MYIKPEERSKYIEYYNKVFNIFLSKLPPNEMLESYLSQDYPDVTHLQDFIGGNLKKEYHWMTNISILDTADLIVQDSFDNGNIEYGIGE